MQYNIELEAAIIGAAMKNAKAITACAEIVKVGDFYDTAYAETWNRVIDLYAKGMGVDVITLGDALESAGILNRVLTPNKQFSGRAALSWMRENTDIKNAPAYAAQVRDYSTKRKAEELFTKGVQWSRNGRAAADILNDVTRELAELSAHDAKAQNHSVNVMDAVGMAYDHAEAAARGEIVTLKTGYTDIDHMLGGGMIAPEIFILAARPGQGKTALMTGIAKNVMEAGGRVLFFSLEMLSKQIGMRLIAMETGIEYGKQKSGKLTQEEWNKFIEAMEKTAKYAENMIINDMPAITASGMRREARRLGGKFDLFVMDYIQLGGDEGEEYQTRDLQIASIMRGIKSLAKEFNVPFLAAAQMSREVEKRGDKKPQLSDLRESGSIENDADVVAFIHHPDEANFADSELIFAKNRNGSLGKIDLFYNAKQVKFENAAVKYVNAKR